MSRRVERGRRDWGRLPLQAGEGIQDEVGARESKRNARRPSKEIPRQAMRGEKGRTSRTAGKEIKVDRRSSAKEAQEVCRKTARSCT